MAEVLDGLRAKGCAVFHDIVEGGFNVDHVVISPHGIYVIETKTLRKPPLGEISFSGDELIAGTERALAATAERELTIVPSFSGRPEQLWRIDQLTDGTYRLMPKAVPDSTEPLALSAVGSSMPTLSTYRADSDRQRWILSTP